MNINFINKIKDQLDQMEGISLEEMNHVRLMRRTDTKYVVPIELLPAILDKIREDYWVFELEGERLQPYETVYYDTPTYDMYHHHHSTKRNRYKVRLRQYVITGISYLEVKFKNNKRETIKNRQPAGEGLARIGEDGGPFVSQHTPYSKENLQPVIENNFDRITLVSKHRPERVTIDLDLRFKGIENGKEKAFHHLVIIEVKKERHARFSDVMTALRQLRVKKQGFSKYCMGLAVINPEVKINLFKLRLRKYKLMAMKYQD